jgi:hypothetical protein
MLFVAGALQVLQELAFIENLATFDIGWILR